MSWISRARLTREILKVRCYSMGPTSFEEWEMPVPWGKLCGKWWGDKKTAPMVAIHEYRQNASAFDKLIPKLNVPSVLAVDLPGHGRSSHFGKGKHVTHMEFLIALRHLTLKLPPVQLSFIGHGLGSYLSYLFAASFFKQVETFISIECGRHVFPVITSCRPNGFGEVIDRCFEIENAQPASITEEELLNIMKNTGRMSNEAAQILSSRASQPNGDKLIFTNDPRYELFFFSSFLDADILTFAENLRCDMIEIRNTADDELTKYLPGETKKPAGFDSNLQQLARRRGPEFIRQLREKSSERLRASCRHFFAHQIKTPGHALLDDATEIAQIVNDYYAMDLEVHQII